MAAGFGIGTAINNNLQNGILISALGFAAVLTGVLSLIRPFSRLINKSLNNKFLELQDESWFIKKDLKSNETNKSTEL